MAPSTPSTDAKHLKLPSIKDCLPLAELNKELGNAAFKKGQYDDAASKYREGVRLIEEVLLEYYAMQWRVSGENSVTVFAEPSKDSEPIDTIKPGQRVRGKVSNDQWLQLMSPEGLGELINAFLPYDGSDDSDMAPVLTEELRQKGTLVWLALELNLAQISIKGKHWHQCLEHTNRVLSIDRDNCKALYRRAIAASNLESVGFIQQAEHDLLRAAALEPTNKEVHATLVKVRGLLKAIGKNLQESQDMGWSQLLLAAKEQCIVEVGELLESNANVDEKGPENWTPLTLAAEKGYIDVTDQLLAARASVDLVGPRDTSALIIAAQKGHSEVAMQLIGAGADVNLPDPDLNASALMLAVQLGDVFLINRLIVAGAKIDAVETRGISSLMFASQAGRSDIVKLLLDAKAQSNMKMVPGGGSALMFAAQYGHGIAVSNLLKYEADVNLQDDDGRTPLMYCAHFGQREVVNRLMAAKAMIDQIDNAGNTALMLSVRNKHFSVMEMFISAKANLDLATNDGASALRLAAEAGEAKVLVRLLDAQASLESAEHSGHSSLTLAAYNGHSRVVEHLISAKAILDHKADNGTTALMFGAKDGYKDVVDMLIRAGANPRLKDDAGKDALKLAEESSRHRVVERLREALS